MDRYKAPSLDVSQASAVLASFMLPLPSALIFLNSNPDESILSGRAGLMSHGTVIQRTCVNTTPLLDDVVQLRCSPDVAGGSTKFPKPLLVFSRCLTRGLHSHVRLLMSTVSTSFHVHYYNAAAHSVLLALP